MKNKGFSLIELLVVMGIIAVLTGMAAFNFSQSRMRARDIQRKNDLSQLQKALEVYKNDIGYYPDMTTSAMQAELLNNDYIKTNFNDPKSSGWPAYEYQRPTSKTYRLVTCLENRADTTRTSDLTLCSGFMGSNDCDCNIAAGATRGVKYILIQP